MGKTIAFITTAAMGLCLSVQATGQTPSTEISTPSPDRPWLNRDLSPEVRARAAVAAMTLDEKLRIIFGYSDQAITEVAKVPDEIVSPELKTYIQTRAIKGAAGFVPGVPRLGIPDQWQTDASMGVRNSFIPSTALPSSLATAASFDPEVSRAGGAMIGAETRATGHNTMLSGGVNLAREPRNGRNFEYTGEDPLLAGTMAGALIEGIQSNKIVSTDQALCGERCGDPANHARRNHLRRSDAPVGPPGVRVRHRARVAGLGDVLLQPHQRPLGLRERLSAQHRPQGRLGLQGLRHERLGRGPFDGHGREQRPRPVHRFLLRRRQAVVRAAGDEGGTSIGRDLASRLDDMVGRVLWALFAKGAVDNPVKIAPIDYAANAKVSQKAAEESLVLLKNDGNLLPLRGVKSIAVIGGNADKGVLAGGGSSDVTPVGGAVMIDKHTYMPSPPLAALKRRTSAGENRLRCRQRPRYRRCPRGGIRRRDRVRHAAQ